jgi:hypothetical protein
MFNASAVAVPESRKQFELIIKFCGHVKVNVHRLDHEHQSGLFNLPIRNAILAKHLNTAPFEVV